KVGEMNPHRASLWTGDAAAERGITGSARHLHISEILRRLANGLEQTYRRIVCVVIVCRVNTRSRRHAQHSAQRDDDESSHIHGSSLFSRSISLSWRVTPSSKTCRDVENRQLKARCADTNSPLAALRRSE